MLMLKALANVSNACIARCESCLLIFDDFVWHVSLALQYGCCCLQDVINMFNDHELELLISGLPEIDVDDLRANTEYTGYTPAAKQVQWFWELVAALSKEDLALLVQFVTGTSKVPLEGFKALQVLAAAAFGTVIQLCAYASA